MALDVWQLLVPKCEYWVSCPERQYSQQMELFKDYWLASLHLAQLDSSCWKQSLQWQPLLRRNSLGQPLHLRGSHWLTIRTTLWIYIYIYIYISRMEGEKHGIFWIMQECLPPFLWWKGKSKYKNRDGLFPFVLSRSSMQAIMVLALLGGVQRSSGLSLQTSEEQTKLLFKQVFNTVGLLPFSILCIQLSWQIIQNFYE
jgi:hypothetical protein